MKHESSSCTSLLQSCVIFNRETTYNAWQKKSTFYDLQQLHNKKETLCLYCIGNFDFLQKQLHLQLLKDEIMTIKTNIYF